MTASLKKIAIFGYPAKHSLSPAMHNAAFLELGLDYSYHIVEMAPEQLAQAVIQLRQDPWYGANVTIPHKEAVFSYVDEISTEAKAIGAINTIVREDHKLKGHNTDAFGFVQPLLHADVELRDKNIFVYGAGGAARAVVYALLSAKVGRIYMAARTPERALQLQADFKSIGATEKMVVGTLIGQEVCDADVVINTSPVGMSTLDAVWCEPAWLRPEHICYDLIYRPALTPFMVAAQQMQCAKVIGGLDMLLWQGVKAFELWTGYAAPVPVMKRALQQSLNIPLS